MEIDKILEELRQERAQLDEAILSIERLALGQGSPRNSRTASGARGGRSEFGSRRAFGCAGDRAWFGGVLDGRGLCAVSGIEVGESVKGAVNQAEAQRA
jgi:hypothetical protein